MELTVDHERQLPATPPPLPAPVQKKELVTPASLKENSSVEVIRPPHVLAIGKPVGPATPMLELKWNSSGKLLGWYVELKARKGKAFWQPSVA